MKKYITHVCVPGVQSIPPLEINPFICRSAPRPEEREQVVQAPFLRIHQGRSPPLCAQTTNHTAQHSTTTHHHTAQQHTTTPHSTPPHRTAQHRTAQQHSTAPHSTHAPHRTATHYHTAQHSTPKGEIKNWSDPQWLQHRVPYRTSILAHLKSLHRQGKLWIYSLHLQLVQQTGA